MDPPFISSAIGMIYDFNLLYHNQIIPTHTHTHTHMGPLPQHAPHSEFLEYHSIYKVLTTRISLTKSAI